MEDRKWASLSSTRTRKGWTGQVRRELLGRKKPRGAYWGPRSNSWRKMFKPELGTARFNPLNWFKPNGKWSKPHRRIVLGLVLTGLIIGGIFTADQALKTRGTPLGQGSPIDPFTVLWKNDLGGTPGTLDTWSIVNAQVCNPATCTFASVKLQANATYYAGALSKGSVDLSTVSGKELVFKMAFFLVAGCCDFATEVYLTRNATLATGSSQGNYNPEFDNNVALIMRLAQVSGGNGNFAVFFQRNIVETITSNQVNCATGSDCFVNDVGVAIGTGVNSNTMNLALNYTGASGGGGNNAASQAVWATQANPHVISTNLPWFIFQSQPYYVGLWQQKGATTPVTYLGYGFNSCVMANLFDASTANCMQLASAIPIGSTTASTIDTGGFFGPIIKALIGIGVFIFNGILAFIAFIVPALEAALNFLVGIVKAVLNGIGVAFGFPASPGLGDDIFTFIGSVITLFTVQVPNAIGQISNIFNGWINSLVIIFTTGVVGQIFAFLAGILLFGVNIVSFAFGLFTTAMWAGSVGLPWWLFVWFIAFNADDGMNGWVKWFETVKWVAFDIGVKYATNVINWTIDIVTASIGILPKPFIQAAAKFPRVPIMDIHGALNVPEFNGDSLKEGNLFSILGMLFGFIGMVWYEFTQTGIPGTFAALSQANGWCSSCATNANTAITFYKLFIPMTLLITFLLMVPTLFNSIFGVRLVGLGPGIPVSVRRRGGTPSIRFGVPSRPGLIKQKKHLQGFLERRLKKQKAAEAARESVKEQLRRETHGRLVEAEAEKKGQEEARLKQAGANRAKLEEIQAKARQEREQQETEA